MKINTVVLALLFSVSSLAAETRLVLDTIVEQPCLKTLTDEPDSKRGSLSRVNLQVQGQNVPVGSSSVREDLIVTFDFDYYSLSRVLKSNKTYGGNITFRSTPDLVEYSKSSKDYNEDLSSAVDFTIATTTYTAWGPDHEASVYVEEYPNSNSHEENLSNKKLVDGFGFPWKDSLKINIRVQSEISASGLLVLVGKASSGNKTAKRRLARLEKSGVIFRKSEDDHRYFIKTKATMTFIDDDLGPIVLSGYIEPGSGI